MKHEIQAHADSRFDAANPPVLRTIIRDTSARDTRYEIQVREIRDTSARDARYEIQAREIRDTSARRLAL